MSGLGEGDSAITELCDVVEHLLAFLHPATTAEQEGEPEAYERALDVLRRYRPAV